MKQTDLEKLLADMSLKEKVDQMLQLSGAFYLGDENSVQPPRLLPAICNGG